MAESAKVLTALQTWYIQCEEELRSWAAANVGKFISPMIVLIKGEMGSGKTTLVRYLMEAMDGEEASSPTFSLVNEYLCSNGLVYHFDLYRIDDAGQLDEIGFGEYMGSDSIIFIEWPELGVPYYSEEITTTICIQSLPGDGRQIQWITGIAL